MQSHPFSINFTINDRSDSHFEHRYTLLVQTTWDLETNPPVLAKVPMYPNEVSIEKQQIQYDKGLYKALSYILHYECLINNTWP